MNSRTRLELYLFDPLIYTIIHILTSENFARGNGVFVEWRVDFWKSYQNSHNALIFENSMSSGRGDFHLSKKKEFLKICSLHELSYVLGRSSELTIHKNFTFMEIERQITYWTGTALTYRKTISSPKLVPHMDRIWSATRRSLGIISLVG